MLSAYGQVIAAIPAASGAAASPDVKCGSIDTKGRVAFSEEPNDNAHLVVAAGGKILLRRSLAYSDTSDYGYEGCSVENIDWFGDHLLVVTAERSTTRAIHFDLTKADDAPEAVIISRARVIDAGLLVWATDDVPGLLRAVDPPRLTPVIPLPIRGLHAARELMLLRWGNGTIDGGQRWVGFDGSKYETGMR